MSKRRAPVLLAGRVFSVLRRRQARVVLLLDGVATLLQQWHAANEVHVGCYRVISCRVPGKSARRRISRISTVGSPGPRKA